MNNFSGIYGIRSISHPERVYIGSAINIRKRFLGHKSKLSLGRHPNNKLQYHYSKYSLNDLVFEVIVKCEKQDLVKMEQIFIDLYKPWFNLCPVAYSTLGRAVTEETRKRMSEAKRNMPKEVKQRMANALRGRPCSVETRNKIRTANTGKHHSNEIRKKMSEAARKRPPISEKTREKRSNSWRGNKNPNFRKSFSPETKARMSNNNNSNRLIINLETGIFYKSIKEAAASVEKQWHWLSGRLCGKVINNTMFRYA